MHRRLLVPLVAGLLAAGCSSGGNGNDVASAGRDDGNGDGNGSESADSGRDQEEERLLDWVDCMQDQGIGISDPTRDSDGDLVLEPGPIQTRGGDGDGSSSGEDEPDIDPEELAAAEEACGSPPMVSGDMTEVDPEDRERGQQAALEFAECMREQGITDFPDPDFSDSGSGGAPVVIGGPSPEGGPPGGGEESGASGPFGDVDMSDPQTQAAFEECERILQEAVPEGADGSTRDEGSEDPGT